MLKLVAGRMKGQAAAGPHPAPEVLSAFAENALPEAERGQLLQHLGGCSDCREILYLSLPEAPETQKVLAPQPVITRVSFPLPAFTRPAFRRWVVGWGALAASVAIGVYFTANRLEHRNLAAKVTSAPAVANENETKIAADKTPAEVDQLGARRDAAKSESIDRNMAVALERNGSEAQPEAKHMTGKMQSQLVFEDSGQVHLQAPAAPPSTSGRMASAEGDDRKKESSGQATGAFSASSAGKSDTPGYAGGGLSKARADQDGLAGQAASSVADSAGELMSSPAEGRNVHSPMPMAVKSAAKGTLGGTIVDSAGAVVANAKVTVAGPTGEKAATSDAEGKFSFDPLPPGSYSVKAEASGFKPTELKPVAVLGNLPATVQVRLEPGSVSEAVEVTSAAPEVAEANTTQQAGSGTSLEIVVPAQRTSGLNKQKSSAQASRQRNAIVSAATVSPVLQWTLSPEGVVQRSGDGGKTWQGVSVASGVAFRALSAVGPNIWVGGEAGVLYHSADFGQSWAQSEPMAGRKKLDQDIVRVDFSSALNGTLNAANGEVWATSDGGRTWLRK